MIDNKQVYSEPEFDHWANLEQIDDAERFLIEQKLEKQARTLEAGTGGGRLLLAMQARGFVDLHGYDFVPALIDAARQRDTKRTIDFQVQDATQLSYADNEFDQLVYLQQILCLIPGKESREAGLREAYRILRPGGRIVFSFLSFDARRRHWFYKPYFAYIRFFRWLTGKSTSEQLLPWLKLGGKPNYGALLDREPYVYWFRADEAEDFISSVGFRVLGAGSAKQLANGTLAPSIKALPLNELVGGLYFVCTK